jgi:hypothetical protein
MYAMTFEDPWLVDGCRTGFADHGGHLGDVSPTDLGISGACAGGGQGIAMLLEVA